MALVILFANRSSVESTRISSLRGMRTHAVAFGQALCGGEASASAQRTNPPCDVTKPCL